MITFDDFAKLEIRIGKVISAEKVENADKLLRLMFDFGPKGKQTEIPNEIDVEKSDSGLQNTNQTTARMTDNEDSDLAKKSQADNGTEEREIRQIVSGIAEWYKPEDLVGKLIPVITNLEPRKFRGIESQGMILAADGNGKPVILTPEHEVPPGSKVR